MKRYFKTALTLLAVSLLNTNISAQSPSVTLQLDQTGHAIPPKLYGLMTEEIKYSYDGGLYAELIRNRTFTEVTRPKDGSSFDDNNL